MMNENQKTSDKPNADGKEEFLEHPQKRFLRELTRPTWELELIISGAVIFALFQLPPLIDQKFYSLTTHVSENYWLLFFMGYYYLKIITYVLITSFFLHITARAYWAGLIGLHSVFPKGVDWTKIKYGPVSKSLYQKILPSLPKIIDKSEKFCNLIFSFSFGIIIIFCSSIFYAVGITLLSIIISNSFFDGRHVMLFFYLAFLLIIGPALVASLVDKLFEKRAKRSKIIDSAIRTVLKFYYYMFLVPLIGPINLTFFSNIKKKVISSIFILVIASPVVFFFINDSLMTKYDILLQSYLYFPEEMDQFGIHYKYYEDSRPEDKLYSRVPSIQSEIIQDPYIKLFIPYSPKKHNPKLEKLCPKTASIRGEGFVPLLAGQEEPTEEQIRAAMDCLSRLFIVYLDEKQCDHLEFLFYRHPKSDLHGIVTYIPVDSLPKGRHMLHIQEIAADQEKSTEDRKNQTDKKDSDSREDDKDRTDKTGEDSRKEDKPVDYYIPFWL